MIRTSSGCVVAAFLLFLPILSSAYAEELKRGDSGGEVYELQKSLNSNGYKVTNLGEETSYFGPATERALTQYQMDNAAEILGGPGVLNGLGAYNQLTRKYILKEGFNSSRNDEEEIFTEDLSLGSTHPDVVRLQRFLNSQGYLVSSSGPGSKGQESDYFGEKTMQALIRYQETNKDEILTPQDVSIGTGNLYQATRSHINKILLSEMLPTQRGTLPLAAAGGKGTGASAYKTLNITSNVGGSFLLDNGAACISPCSVVYPKNSTVTVTATPDVGYTFTSWTNCTSVKDTLCTIKLASDRTITASFTPVPVEKIYVTLTVGVSGETNSGSVSGNNILCPSDCTELIEKGLTISLTANPGSGYSFAGWSNCNSITNTCTTTLNDNTQIIASFIKDDIVPPPTNPGISAINTLIVDGNLGSDCTQGIYSIENRTCSAGTYIAYKTITAAVNALKPGKTIYVRSGIYRESISFPALATTVDTPVAIRAYPGEKPILSGAESIKNWISCTASICGNNPNWANMYYADIDATLVPNPKAFLLYEGDVKLAVAQYPNQSDPYRENALEFQPIDVASYGMVDGFISTILTQPDDYWNGTFVRFWSHGANNEMLDRTVADFSAGKITFDTPLTYAVTKGTNPDAYAFVNSLLPEVFDRKGEYVIDTTPNANNTYRVYVWPQDAASLDSIQFVSRRYAFLWMPDNMTIDGLEIKQYGDTTTRSGGIVLPYRSTPSFKNITFTNLVIHDVLGTAGISISNGADIVIRNNKVYNTLTSTRGISVSGVRVLTQLNEVYKTGRTGIYYGGVTDGVIVDNYVHGYMGTHGNGITVYENSDNVLIKNNLVYDLEGAAHITLQSSKNIRIVGNILHGLEKSGYLIADWGGLTGYTQILGNTMLGSNNNSSILKSSNSSSTYSIKNNIIDGGSSVTDQSHNLWVGLRWDQSSRDGWTLKEGEKIETNLANVFVDPSSKDLLLKLGSPAIDAGTSVTGYVTTDSLLGTQVLNSVLGIPDIGAKEYGI